MKAYVVLVGLAGLMPSACLAASPFDGPWTVAQTCPPTGEDVQGYSWTYAATVRNGLLSGQHSPSTSQDGSIRLTGKINADGTATLNANGRTGRSEYSVGHVAPGYAFRFHVQARFSESSGTGTRTEQRQCDFTFAKN